MISRMLNKALRLPRKTKCAIQMMTDAGLISASLLLASILKSDSFSPITEWRLWASLAIVIPVALLLLLRWGFYRSLVRYMSLTTLTTVIAGVTASTVALALASPFIDLEVSISLLTIHALLSTLSIGGLRFLLRSLYHRTLVRHKTRIIIYGAGSAGSQLATSLRQSTEFAPVAFIDDWRGMHGTTVEGIKVHAPTDLPSLIHRTRAQRILLAIPSTTRSRRRAILESLEPFNIAIQTVPGIEDVVSGRAKLQDIRNVSVEDLLGRDPVPPRRELLAANIEDKVVMVTGAGGSIGSELCRQILRLRPSKLLLLEISEFSLYTIEAELARIADAEELPRQRITPLLGSVQNTERLETLMTTFGVQTIYHAAAYKHVPMVEYNVAEGVMNNVFGTLGTARAAIASGVETFVLVSTDKAVRPTNVMGTTKRLAELICQALAHSQTATRFCMVRFGNVLGSSGSVIPLFRDQIARGGPVTVTHPDITRYFMTIPEAAELVLQAGAMGRGGDVFVLDMGEPVKIADLARRMIHLSGLETYSEEQGTGDIRIEFSGLRPGEKLYEEVLVGDASLATGHPRILSEQESHWEWSRLETYLQTLQNTTLQRDIEAVRQLLMQAPTGYRPNDTINDLEWCLRHEGRPTRASTAAPVIHLSDASAQERHSGIHETPSAASATDEPTPMELYFYQDDDQASHQAFPWTNGKVYSST